MTLKDASVLCEAIVDALPLGILAIGMGGKIVFANQAGIDFLEWRAGVLRGGTLMSPIAFLLAEAETDAPVATHSAEVDGELVAIGSIVDEGLGCRIFLIQGKVEVDGGMLAAMYGLRPSEGRVAAALINTGFSQGAAGRHLSISYENIRTHVKHIYSKLRVNTQHALTATILNGPAALMKRMR